MAGLVLKLAPGERFIVNGAVLENGDRPSQIRIADNDARVLRCRDALMPGEVNTPVKRIYYAIQLLITGDLNEADTLPELEARVAELTGIFDSIHPDLVPKLKTMVSRGNYYSALCHMRQMLVIEMRLLAHAANQSMAQSETKVA